jgi:hypothetical protein
MIEKIRWDIIILYIDVAFQDLTPSLHEWLFFLFPLLRRQDIYNCLVPAVFRLIQSSFSQLVLEVPVRPFIQ